MNFLYFERWYEKKSGPIHYQTNVKNLFITIFVIRSSICMLNIIKSSSSRAVRNLRTSVRGQAGQLAFCLGTTYASIGS